MRADSSWLRDGGLVVLAAATLAVAAIALTRSPTPPATVADRPTARASATVDAGSDGPRAVVIAGQDVAGVTALADGLSTQLGWQVEVDAVPGSGYVAGAAGETFGDRIARVSDVDVVLLLSGRQPQDEGEGRVLGGNVQRALAAVRSAAPEAQVVVIAPAAPDPATAAAQREILLAVAARFGAYYVDPTGRGYLAGRPELVTADGSLTPEGADVVATRLAADLRIVLPRTLLAEAPPAG